MALIDPRRDEGLIDVKNGRGTLRFMKWIEAISATALSYVPEDISNKVTSLSSPNNDTYPTTQTVVDYVASQITDPDSDFSLAISQAVSAHEFMDLGT